MHSAGLNIYYLALGSYLYPYIIYLGICRGSPESSLLKMRCASISHVLIDLKLP